MSQILTIGTDCSGIEAPIEQSHYLVKYKRSLTPRECLMLQGFSKRFKIVVSKTQAINQAGNAMSVNVLKAIFRNVFKCTNLGQ